jgi:hypothetical protein
MFRKAEGKELIKANSVIHDSQTERPFEVHSAFGGLAVYRASSAAECRYDAGQHRDCEHVAFHACIKEKAGQAIGVAPRMLVMYDVTCHICTPNSTKEIEDFRSKHHHLGKGQPKLPSR